MDGAIRQNDGNWELVSIEWLSYSVEKRILHLSSRKSPFAPLSLVRWLEMFSVTEYGYLRHDCVKKSAEYELPSPRAFRSTFCVAEHLFA